MDGIQKHGKCKNHNANNNYDGVSMKIALVTGADGFIGSHLVEMLVDKGYKVKALSQYNSFNNWGWLETVNCIDQIEVLTGDIRDPHYHYSSSFNFCKNKNTLIFKEINLAILVHTNR